MMVHFEKETVFRTILLALLAIIAMILLVWLYLSVTQSDLGGKHLEKEGYYSVMLSNGQEYYGTVQYEDSQILILDDVYYFELDRRYMTEDQDVSLIKHGTEIHGPETQITLYQDQILQVEKLRDDSDVVKVIKQGE